jgi:type IV pilus assembly protein PilV
MVGGRTPPTCPRPRRGASIIEVLIAFVLLMVAIGGLLSTSNAIAKQVGGGRRQTVAAAVAQARLDSLSSLSCANLALAGVASATRTTKGIQESWLVTQGVSTATVRVTVTIPRQTTPIVYTTMVACR